MNLFEGCEAKRLARGLAWTNEPPEWRFDDGRLLIVPAAKTDFYRPYGGGGNDSAGLLATTVEGDFTLITRVTVSLVAFGDAAAVTVRAGATQWAKLCLERSPLGETSAVSVVTDPWSDDANNELAPQTCSLRLTRKGNLFGMHYSVDGVTWRFVRSFAMEAPRSVLVGVHAQAPFEGGCRATFVSAELRHAAVEDFRSGE